VSQKEINKSEQVELKKRESRILLIAIFFTLLFALRIFQTLFLQLPENKYITIKMKNLYYNKWGRLFVNGILQADTKNKKLILYPGPHSNPKE